MNRRPRSYEEDLALLAAGEETGWWDDHGRPAPWPEDFDDPDSGWSTAPPPGPSPDDDPGNPPV